MRKLKQPRATDINASKFVIMCPFYALYFAAINFALLISGEVEFNCFVVRLTRLLLSYSDCRYALIEFILRYPEETYTLIRKKSVGTNGIWCPYRLRYLGCVLRINFQEHIETPEINTGVRDGHGAGGEIKPVDDLNTATLSLVYPRSASCGLNSTLESIDFGDKINVTDVPR